MRLLQPQEREVAYKKERDFARNQAQELSSEMASIVKLYNQKKSELEATKSLLIKDYNEFRDEMFEKRKSLEEEVRVLENKRNNALVPLYEKEKELQRKENYLTGKEEGIENRELNVRIREKDAKELKSICDAILAKVEGLEKDINKREKALEERTLKFNNFRANQERLFKRDEQKLRDWLENERKKLKHG